jgi:hypothetical protein
VKVGSLVKRKPKARAASINMAEVVGWAVPSHDRRVGVKPP